MQKNPALILSIRTRFKTPRGTTLVYKQLTPIAFISTQTLNHVSYTQTFVTSVYSCCSLLIIRFSVQSSEIMFVRLVCFISTNRSSLYNIVPLLFLVIAVSYMVEMIIVNLEIKCNLNFIFDEWWVNRHARRFNRFHPFYSTNYYI